MSSIRDDFATANDPETLTRRIAERFCAGMLNAALPKRFVSSLTANDRVVVILEAPSPDWVDYLEDYLREAFPQALVVASTDTARKGLQKATSQSWVPLLHSRAVVAVSQDPGAFLPSLLFDTADHCVVLAKPDYAMVRDCIIDLTTCMPRRLKAKDLEVLDAGQLLAALRPASSAGTMARRIAATAARQSGALKVPKAPPLEDLALPEAVNDWARRVATDLPQGRTSGLEHVLLEGQPGTGKTLLVHSLAATAGLPLVMTNAAQWHQVGKGHLSEVLGAQASFFAELVRLAPAIGVIDELDSVPSRQDLRGEFDPWWIGMTNGLLTAIDQLAATQKPVLLVGITNHAKRLDPALTRAGRLGLHLTLPPPQSAEQRLKMLRLHLPDALKGADLSALLPFLKDQSQAGLGQVAVKAMAKASDEGTGPNIAHLLSVLAPPDTRSPDLRWTVALHEAGHAVMAMHLGRGVQSVSILPGTGYQGETEILEAEDGVLTPQSLEDKVRILLAGRAADMVVGTGPNSGARSDLARAAELIHDAAFELLFYGPPSRWSRPGSDTRDRRRLVEERVAKLLDECLAIVASRRPAVEAVAEALLARPVLIASDLAAILAPFGLSPPNTPHRHH